MTIHEKHKEQDHASTQVRKYASTLKTSATLIAGLWLGIAGIVSASTESVPVQTTIPSAAACAAEALEGDSNVVQSWWWLMLSDNDSPAQMDSLLTSPELINCRDTAGRTVAHLAVALGYLNGDVDDAIEVAKWAVSRGIDLTIKTNEVDGQTAYDNALRFDFDIYLSRGGRWIEILDRLFQIAQIVKPSPSPKTCAAEALEGDSNVVQSWGSLMRRYASKGITLDEFKAKMDSLLTSPELINCKDMIGWTVAHMAVHNQSIEAAKWAVSKDIDLTIKGGSLFSIAHRRTAYAIAYAFAKSADYDQKSRDIYNKIAEILKPPPASATKSCAEVDGQTPPANEYCIVAENVQSSVEKDINFIIKGLTGLDEFHTIHSGLSGTGLYPGWTAEFTFTCSVLSQGCGESNYNFEHLDKRHSQSLRERIRKDFGFGVFCGDSGNLLDAKEVEAGESVSFTHSSETERSSPWYRQCSAKSAGPFTLSIKTTRLAQ